jgi:DNA repair ATPase RecN
MCDIDVLIAELQSKCDELDARAQQLRARMNEIRSEYQQMLRQHQEKFRSVEREHDAALRELNATRARFEQLSALKRTISQERNALRAAGENWLEQTRRVVYGWLRERLVE